MLLAIAPMLDWTDRHYRYFIRQITQNAVLYTEMVVADAIIHGNREKLLEFSEIEQPLILQVGGSDPAKLAKAAIIAEGYGYSGINLNVGCPSDRVKSGNFGACLMEMPDLVATCIKTMQDSVSIPVSIKHRTGLNYEYDYAKLHNFVEIIAKSGCGEFIIHARNAILTGLSPKQNREVPPLRYDYVYQLKQDFPQLQITLNGGVKTLDAIKSHLLHVDGVMLGREAYHNPYLLLQVEARLFNHSITTTTAAANQVNLPTRKQIAANMVEYMALMQKNGIRLHHITRHMMGLYHGCQQAKEWRHGLSDTVMKSDSLQSYLALVEHMVD